MTNGNELDDGLELSSMCQFLFAPLRAYALIENDVIIDDFDFADDDYRRRQPMPDARAIFL